MNEIENEITRTGSYTHTYEELSYGAKLAWRNSNRCIGRLFWDSLNVEDARDIDNEENFLEAIYRHIDIATNGGKIKPLLQFSHLKMRPKSIITN